MAGSNFKPGEFEALQAEARPHATSLAQMIAAIANERSRPGAYAFAILVGEIALQNVVTTVVLDLHPSHSHEGEEMIRKSYAAFAQAAVDRWYKKRYSGNGKRGALCK